MSLKEIVLGTALALGACAIGPKPVCSYEQNNGRCTREYKDTIVNYTVEITEKGTPLCAAEIIYMKDHTGFNVWDIGCDGTAERYVDFIGHQQLGDEVVDFGWTDRDMANKEHDKFFSKFESLFRDKTFLELKEKVLGDKK